MRTVRSVAQARNRAPRQAGVIILAVLALLAALAVRAGAAPRDDDDSVDSERIDIVEHGDDAWLWQHASRVPANASVNVPGTSANVPSVSAVVAAAYRAGGVADDPTPSWRRRSRLAALVPWIAVRAGQNESWREVTDPTVSHGLGVDVRAVWHFDRLVFDGAEPRIAMLDVARRRERRRVAALAIHLYFDWLADQSAETAAELDAITDGWFSEVLAKPRESP